MKTSVVKKKNVNILIGLIGHDVKAMKTNVKKIELENSSKVTNNVGQNLPKRLRRVMWMNVVKKNQNGKKDQKHVVIFDPIIQLRKCIVQIQRQVVLERNLNHECVIVRIFQIIRIVRILQFHQLFQKIQIQVIVESKKIHVKLDQK